MAIEVSCPSCQAAVHVDDTLAGKDILCPNCKQRLTVPSLASGQPEAMPARPEADEDDDRSREGPGDRDSGLPRWRRDDDYDMPSRHETTRWNATLTGLALIFWNWLFIAIFVGILMVLGLLLSGNVQAAAMRPGVPPPPQMVAFGLVSLGLICVLVILFIVAFVGMCMCCTVPSESGAKGRAVTSVILVGVSVLMGMALFVASVIQGIQMAQQFGGAPPPGQPPFAPATMMVIAIVGGVDLMLLVTMWLMFHRAIADYFQNKSLARMSVLFIFGFLIYQGGSIALNIFVNPTFQGGNLFQLQLNSPGMIFATIWGAVWLIGLAVFFLYIVRETRRTIREDQAAVESGAAMEETM